VVEENTKNIFSDLVVVKRSGQRVEFNSTKIALAIKKAFDQVRPLNSESEINKVYEDVLNYINSSYAERKTINVEDIQDIIETKLKSNSFKDVYETFSDYRIRRATSRKAFGLRQQHKFTKAIERIGDFRKDSTPNEILLDFGKTISCEYTKAFVLDNKYVRSHEEGNIYIHNLDYFNIGKLSSTHPIFNNTSDSNFLNNLIFSALNIKLEIDGEICIDALDYLLIPFVNHQFKNDLKENLHKYLDISGYLEYINIKKIEEIIDKQNSIYFENSLFDNFILNKKVEEIFNLAYNDSMLHIKSLLLNTIESLLTKLNNNYLENKKYSISLGSNNSLDGLLISNIYLEALNNLDYLENLTTIFKISKNINNDLLNKVSSLIISEKNIALSNIDASYNQENTEYFGNGQRVYENYVYEENTSNGRMVVASVSINVGRLGFKYENKDIKDFYLALDGWTEMAKNCLVNIFEIIGDKNKENYQILFSGNILDDEKLEYGQKIRKTIKKGVLNLELAGLNECVLTLEKDEKKRKELLIDIIKYVKEKCLKYTKETKLNFVVSETSKHRPLKKLMELDKAIYGIRKNINDKDYYSRIDSLFEFKTNKEDDFKYIGEYQKLLTGGNLVKINLAKSTKQKDILNIINYLLEYDVGFIKFDGEKYSYGN
jgi:ribonucleoside-triphosphate reductase